jgi:hypothetical protein
VGRKKRFVVRGAVCRESHPDMSYCKMTNVS